MIPNKTKTCTLNLFKKGFDGAIRPESEIRVNGEGCGQILPYFHRFEISTDKDIKLCGIKAYHNINIVVSLNI